MTQKDPVNRLQSSVFMPWAALRMCQTIKATVSVLDVPTDVEQRVWWPCILGGGSGEVLCLCVQLPDDGPRSAVTWGTCVHVARCCTEVMCAVGVENSALDRGQEASAWLHHFCGLFSSVKGIFDIFFLQWRPSFKSKALPRDQPQRSLLLHLPESCYVI